MYSRTGTLSTTDRVEARVGDRLLAFLDLLDGPYFAVGDMVQGGHDVGGPA